MKRRGFTIVELLMVIAVLGVLTGIITTAASSAIRQARSRRAQAIKMVIQNGIATYRAQYNYWPPKGGRLNDWSDNGLKSGKHVDYLENEEYNSVMHELLSVSAGSKGSPVFDPNGLLVASSTVANSKKGYGQDFSAAVAQNKRHGRTLSLKEMTVGYAEDSKGYFRTYVIQYNADSDTVRVLTQDEYSNMTGLTWPNKK